MKKAKKFEIGQEIAKKSDGRITLAIEDGVAVLRGEFTRAERKPLRFKKGAGWRYKVVDGIETWSLRVEQKAKQKAESESATIYVQTSGYNMTFVDFYQVTRSTSASVWLRQIDSVETPFDMYGQQGTVMPVPNKFIGQEFRKALRRGTEYLTNGLHPWDGKPMTFNYMD